MSMSVEEVLQMVRDLAERIDPQLLFLALRKKGFRHLKKRTIEVLRYCIALDRLGIPINPFIMSALTNRSVQPLRIQLHTLGDKNLLVLCRKKGPQQWVLSKIFREVIEEWNLV